MSTFTSASEPSPRRAFEHQHHVQMKAQSLPVITSASNRPESPLAMWTEAPTTMSPAELHPRPAAQNHDIASSNEAPSYGRCRPHGREPLSGSVANIGDGVSSVACENRHIYAQRISRGHDADFQMKETGCQHLHIGEYSERPDPCSLGVTMGQKRHASSLRTDNGPPLYRAGSATDLYKRRESPRTSPSSRCQSLSGLMPSSPSVPKSGLYVSSSSLDRISITSMNSYRRLSPRSLSPALTDCSHSPYATPLSSREGSMSRTNHSLALSDNARRLVISCNLSGCTSHSKQGGGPKIQGDFFCTRCSKKPQKFDTQEELQYSTPIKGIHSVYGPKTSVHELGKRYGCAYCRNSFKNKNEAKRHQTSIHLRRYSWSCAALSSYAAAFHNSPSRPDEADSCGYCGKEFLRSGNSSATHQVAAATKQDWEVRKMHLRKTHKFRQCNHAKKFFRADHFRQHLKHSHAGIKGEWTTRLERACMKDEQLLEPIRCRNAQVTGSTSECSAATAG